MFNVVIDGTRYQVPEGGSLLDALRAVGIDLPAMCHDDRLAPTGACRLCLVHVAGTEKPVPACTTPIRDGLTVATNTPDLDELRRSLLEMIARHYPADALSAFPDKPFHRALHHVGLEGAGPMSMPSEDLVDRSHPYIAVDMARCIDCYRCVRICAELQGQFVWHIRDRGQQTRIEPDAATLRDSSCVACGACVDTCPTGALEDRGVSPLRVPSQWTRTVCPYCGVGCEMDVGTRDGHIVAVKPRLDAPVNKGHLCVKGRYAFGFVSAPDRMTQPMIRAGHEWRRVSWNEARSFVAGRLPDVMRDHGPDSIGILGSARATNEDNYVTQKFARAVIGTNNVDCCARVCHTPSAAALKRMLGTGLATNSFDDIEVASTILVCGANPTENHPIVGARIKQAALRGAHLIVIDPRRIELAEYADCHLAVRPGSNIAVLNAMAHTIVKERLCEADFIARRVSAFDDFERFIEQWSPERAARESGVPADDICRAARLYATGAPALSVHGLGLTEHVQGTEGVMALIDLALLTGNIGKPGTGINPLRGQNNVQGAAHMGCDPSVLPGSMSFAQGRDAVERLWGTTLSDKRGLHVLAMMDAAIAGTLKALWAVGYDVLLTNPNANETARALRALDLLIVQDMFLTETAREYGTVFLPACSSFEKDGTFMNGERRIQRVRAALRPHGASKPDWQIMSEVARAMGSRGFDYSGPEMIWNEVRALCDGARGMSYSRLEAAGLQWPCPTDDHPGTSILHADTFAHGSRATLEAIHYHPTTETVSPAYPFQLTTGRSLYQFNAGTMTGRTANNELRPSDVLEISPDDAEEQHLGNGEVVRVASCYGAVDLPVRISTAIRQGQLFATFQTPSARVNAVTGSHRDTIVGTPEYKVTAVRLELLR